MLDGRLVARAGEGGLAGCGLSYRVVVLPEKEEKKKKIGTVSGELALSCCVYKQS